VELSEQSRLDPRAGLIARPHAISKRFDHMIGRYSDMGLSAFEHLDDSLKHTDDGAERPVSTLSEASQAVEVPE
jgi:hypothetical protein